MFTWPRIMFLSLFAAECPPPQTPPTGSCPGGGRRFGGCSGGRFRRTGGWWRPTVGAAGQEAVVEDGIKGRAHKLGGHLRAQVVNDQQVTGCVLLRLALGLLGVGELGLLQAGKEVYRRLVHHTVASVGHGPGDASGQEGLAQPRVAVQKQVARLQGEALGIPAAGLEGPGHHRPGTDPQVGVNLVGIIAEAEALKGLPAAPVRRVSSFFCS